MHEGWKFLMYRLIYLTRNSDASLAAMHDAGKYNASAWLECITKADAHYLV